MVILFHIVLFRRMDSSCNCSSKIDKILEKIDCLEQFVKSVQDGMKTLLQDTKTSNSEELPRKKRRHFQNRFPESSMKGTFVLFSIYVLRNLNRLMLRTENTSYYL